MAHMFLQVPDYMLSQIKSGSKMLSTTPLQPLFLGGGSASPGSANQGRLDPSTLEYQSGAPKPAPLEKEKESSSNQRDNPSALGKRSDPSSVSPSETLRRAESLTSAGEMLKFQPVATSVASRASKSSKWLLQTESQERGPLSFEAALIAVLANPRGQVVLRNLSTKGVLQKEFVLREFNTFAERLESKLQEQVVEGLRDTKGPTASTLPEGDSVVMSRSGSSLHSELALDSMTSALRSRRAPSNTLEELFFMCEGSFGILSRIREGNRQVLNRQAKGNRGT